MLWLHLPGSLAANASTFLILGSLENKLLALAINAEATLPEKVCLSSVLIGEGIKVSKIPIEPKRSRRLLINQRQTAAFCHFLRRQEFGPMKSNVLV